MSTTAEPLFVIADEKELENVKKWVKDGRGLRRWVSHDLGAGRPDIITPGDSGRPHWAYPEYSDIQPNQIAVEHRKPIELVPEWYPKCEKCNGSGKRSYQEISDLRNEPLEATKISLKHIWPEVRFDEDHFACNFCRGTGHIVDKIKIRVKREYWGGYTFSRAKPNAMAEKIRKHHKLPYPGVEWDWSHVGHGLGEVYFYQVEKTTLDKEIANEESKG